MKFYLINDNYINYLKSFDNKVPNVNYKDKYKLFLGQIKINNDSNMRYYIPLTSYKTKFENMPNRVDFIKIQDPIDDTIIGAIDINNMIPAPTSVVKEFDYNAVRDNETFESQSEIDKYFKFVMSELQYLNDIEDKIIQNARTVFSLTRSRDGKFTNLKNRCCNFLLLQQKAIDFNYIVSYEIDNIVDNVLNELNDLNSDDYSDDYDDFIDNDIELNKKKEIVL